MDAFAAWCAILREHGEVMDNHFGFARAGTPETLARTWRIPHEEVDGARGIPKLIAEMGMPAPPVPRSRESGPPALLARAAALHRELTEAPHAPVPWRRFDPEAREGRNARIGHAFFDREMTAEITRRAEQACGSLNSYLHWALDRGVYPELAHPSPSHRWAVAVNMLGAAKGAGELATAAAQVGVVLPDGATPSDVRQVVGARLRANAHWGAWDSLRLLGFVGPRAMRRFTARYYARERHSWVGGFSNVGAWDVDAGYWYALQPVTRTQPVGAAAVIVGGRLGIALQVHAALTGADARDLAQRWRDVLLPT